MGDGERLGGGAGGPVLLTGHFDGLSYSKSGRAVGNLSRNNETDISLGQDTPYSDR